jgi:sulfatase modifying factor 1
VENVSWNDICEGNNSFLTKLNQKTKEEYGDISTFSLPSEAQWEYAAAGGSHWDNLIMKYAGSNKLEDVGWFGKNSNNQTMPVGLKQPNALGLHDMSGNMWEWCQDYWINDITALPKSGESNPKKSDTCALRGGSYFYGRHDCCFRFRFDFQPGYRDSNYGFRLCFFPVYPTN